MIKNTKNENILWTSKLVKEKEFNWDFVNGKKFNEITFFFNRNRDLILNDRNKLNEIMKIVRKKIEKFIFADDYYRCTVSFAPYGNQGFKISFEFDSCLYLKRSNDFINILSKVFRTKFKKFNYDGHEFTFLLNDENAELFTHVGKFT